MSMNNLTIDGEFRYIVQWFNEWSELQRDDFVPVVVKFITGSPINDDDDEVAATLTPVNMNGLPNDLELNGRPMSLFQCRINLFNQWNRRWPREFKEKLQHKITEIDGKVGEKIKLALNPNNSGSLTNGYAPKHSLKLKENAENLMVGLESEVMVLNDPMKDVLNNETSVDDIETNEDMDNVIAQPVLNNSLHTDHNNVVADGDVNNDNQVSSNNTSHNHSFNDCKEPVEQVIQMLNLQINEEKAETEKDNKDVTENVEQKEQQPPTSVTVTVNPVVVTQTITTNAEVPLVV